MRKGWDFHGRAAGIRAEIENLQATPFELILDFLEIHNRGEYVYIPSVSAMSDTHPMKALFTAQDIRSLLMIPLIADGLNIGFVGFDAVRAEKEFTVVEINLLRVFAELIVNIEKRWQTEEELVATRALNESIVQNINEGIAIINHNGIIAFANPALLKMTGYALEETIGIHWTLFIPPQYHNLIKKAGTQHLKGTVDRYELNLNSKAGLLIPVQASGGPHYDYKSGEITGTVAVLTSITELKQAQEAVKASEERLRMMTKNIQDVVFETDADGYYTYVSASSEAIFGYGQELLGQRAFDYIHPDDVERMIMTYISTVESNEAARTEYRFRHPEKGYIWVEGVGSTYQSSSNETMILVTVRDITKRKETEEALRFNKENLRATLNSIGDAVIATDVDGLITRMNPVAENLTGWAEDEARGKPLTEVFKIYQSGAMDPADNPVLQVMQTGEVISLANHTLLVSKKGDKYHIADSAAPIRDACGLTSGVVLVFRDITDEYLMRETLKDSEMRYRTLVDNIPIGIYRNTPGLEGRFLMANPAFLNIFGIADEEELLEHKVSDLYINPLDRKAFSEQLLKKNELAGVELNLKKLDGTPIWVSVTAHVVRDENNIVQYFDCALEEVTARKQAEADRASSLSILEATLESTADGLLVVNRSGKVTKWNIKFLELWDIPIELAEEGDDEKLLEHVIDKLAHPEEFIAKVRTLYSRLEEISFDTIELADGRLLERYSQPQWLGEEIIGRVWSFRDITERKKYETELKYLSYHDQLTGLFNRHFLEEEMKRFDTERQLPISIIMADLNGLKLVNDTYNHHTGDAMLKSAAEILKSVCRNEDILARFGGDEFVLYLPRTPHNEAQKIRDRIEKACRKEQINEVPLSLATGLAVKVRAEQKLSDLLKEAEDNMYRDKLTESRSGKSAIVNSFLHTLAAKSSETEAHTHNMQEAANSIGEKLGLHHSEMHRLSLLITLHDIGKINIPEEVLTKKGPLDAAEWEIMKKHSETGYRIAKGTDNFAHVAEDILAHHERWDGSGYPQGLKREAIPLLARITAIVDAYEVMSNGRPYQKAKSKSEIVAELKNCSGTQFDPELVDIFLSILETNE